MGAKARAGWVVRPVRPEELLAASLPLTMNYPSQTKAVDWAICLSSCAVKHGPLPSDVSDKFRVMSHLKW